MTFQVLEVDLSSSDDWEQFYAAQWETWRMGSSSQPIWKLMLPPNIGIGDDTEFEAMKASSARTLENSKADPHDHWVKVVDADTGEIVAGALWKIFDSNPYRAPFAPFDAVWHPPGQMRQMCNQMNTQLRACRPRFMAAAHAFLSVIFAHPDKCNPEAAALLLQWGTEQADKLGIEAYVEAAYLGRVVYERHGFVVMNILGLGFQLRDESPGDEWLRLVRHMEENPVAIMWRPVGGNYVQGETVVPWEGAPRKVSVGNPTLDQSTIVLLHTGRRLMFP